MKKAFLLMVLVLPLFLSAQEKYVVKGKIGTFGPPARVFLSYTENSQTVTDSATIKDGMFEFLGQVADITVATLMMDDKGIGSQAINGAASDRIPIFLQRGTTIVSAADSLSKATLSGTKANEDYMRYRVFLNPVINANKALQAEYYSASGEKRNSKEFIEYLQKKEAAIKRQSKELNENFIAGHPDAYISFQVLIDQLSTDSYPDAASLQAQFSKLSKNLRESKAGITYQERLDKLKTVAVGARAPEFVQPDTNGAPVKLSSFRGKYVLVDFWASWCGPCRAENPNLVTAYNNFKGKNFTILSVSLDQPGRKDDWMNAIHKDGLCWTQVSDLKSWGNDAAILYGARAIPQNLLIDPAGKIIAKNIFGEDLQNKLKEIFGGM